MKMQLRSRLFQPTPAEQFLAALYRGAFSFVLVFFALNFPAAILFAQNAPSSIHPTESDVEAAYLYNFGKFVTWPSAPQPETHAGPQASRMNICVLGQDPFGSILDQLVSNEKFNGRPLQVLRMSNTDQVSDCSIIFISRSEASQLKKDLSRLAQFPILTVSDIPEFVERGGMIQFVLLRNNVRFQVNLAAAQQCNLTLSSQLLKVATKVIQKTSKEPSQ